MKMKSTIHKTGPVGMSTLLTKHAKNLDGASTYTQLILLDYSVSWNSPSRPNVEQLVPNFRLAKRGIVQNRHWDKHWVELEQFHQI